MTRHAIIALLLVLAAPFVLAGCGDDADIPQAGNTFAADSPWNSLIPDNARVDPNSAAMMAAAQPRPALYASTVEEGIPIVAATGSTPTHSVTCRRNDWGACPFTDRKVPIPADFRPQNGTYGPLVVVDDNDGVSFELWQAQQTEGVWSVDFGAVNELSGSGWSGLGGATASGASLLGGVVRVREVELGVIPHAVALRTNNACASAFRGPARHTDGTSTRPDCLPEGARLQLDPTIDLTTLQVPTAQRAIALALQKYGGFVVGIGGAGLSLAMERDLSASEGDIGSVYAAAGIRWDHDDLSGVPWNRLRVVI
ncbi:hypothetical protein [Gordonia sp. NPDC003422]